MIDQEAQYDGFYCFCTDLLGPADEVIRLNSGRWIVENDFRITKTNLDVRRIYLKRDDRIKAHYLTCFLSLLIYLFLEKKINRGGMHFTTREIGNKTCRFRFGVENSACHEILKHNITNKRVLHDNVYFLFSTTRKSNQVIRCFRVDIEKQYRRQQYINTYSISPKGKCAAMPEETVAFRYLMDKVGNRINSYWSSMKICKRHGYHIADYSIWTAHIDLLKHFGKDIHSPKYIIRMI